MSQFVSVELAPPIEIFNVNRLCNEDPDPNKVNLTIGAYRTEEGRPWVLPIVREAEKRLAADDTQNHEYFPVLGSDAFSQAATRLALGEDSPALKEGRAIGVQCLSGTGSLRVGAEFLARVCGHKTIYISKPTWGNHRLVFKNAGFSDIREYRYWHQQERCIDFAGLCQDLEEAPVGSLILLHGCAHNPTGMDPSEEQWQKITEIIKNRQHFPFIDFAYQGFASGDLVRDAFAVRYMASQGLEMIVCQSFAKNFGLYSARIGNMVLIVSDVSVVAAVKSQLSLLVRGNWSNPPAHGAKIVLMILKDEDMRKQWLECIQTMSGRIKLMRKMLREKLEELGTPGSWSHVTAQIGMFSYTGLSETQCDLLTKKYHIYLLKSGRANMCGLTTKNVDYVARAIDDAVRSGPALLEKLRKQGKCRVVTKTAISKGKEPTSSQLSSTDTNSMEEESSEKRQSTERVNAEPEKKKLRRSSQDVDSVLAPQHRAFSEPGTTVDVESLLLSKLLNCDPGFSEIKRKEEKLHHLKLVKLYHQKHNLAQMECTIIKWRTASQKICQELLELVPEPKPSMVELLTTLNIPLELIQYNPEDEIFY